MNRIYVLSLTLALAVAPRIYTHSLWAYTNLPYSVNLVLGSIYLYWAIRNTKLSDYILSAIFIGLSTWTRSLEPFWLIFIFYSLAIVKNKKYFWPILYIFIILLISGPWRLFQSVNHIDKMANVGQGITGTFGALFSSNIHTLIDASKFLYINVIKQYWQGFVVLFGIIITKLIYKSDRWFYVLLLLSNILIMFVGTIFFMKNFSSWNEIPDSLSRMMMYLTPMIVFLLGELISEAHSQNGK